MAKPGKTSALGVKLVQFGMAPVDKVQVTHQALNAQMIRLVQQAPVQRAVVVPLGGLRELAAHEQQLFAGVGEHEPIAGAQIGQLLPTVAGHLGQHGALPMHNFIVRQRQDEIFVKRVDQAEGDVALVVFAVHRV